MTAARIMLKTLLIACPLFAAAAGTPATAASALSEAFVARIRPSVDMLDRSSRLALDTSKDARIRRFAHREAIEQTIAANSLVAWSQANTLAGAEVALGTRLPGAVSVPAEAAISADEVLTGRSVAIDRPLTVTRAPRASAAPDESALTQLSALKGPAFDAAYRTMQHDALRQLSGLYADYKENGDDPALRAFVTREHPKIIRKLAELRRL